MSVTIVMRLFYTPFTSMQRWECGGGNAAFCQTTLGGSVAEWLAAGLIGGGARGLEGTAPPYPNNVVGGTMQLGPPTLTPVDRNKAFVFTNWC